MLGIKTNAIKILSFLLVSIMTVVNTFSVNGVFAMNGICKHDNGYWPSDNWRTSTPEKQGMDSGKLLDMFKEIQKEKTPIHSVLIIKNGYLVTEAYFAPYNKNMKHSIYSSTKSVISTLVGIAIDEGYIKGVDQKVLDFFPEVEVKRYEHLVKDMTIEHLLTMSAGHTEDSSNPIFLTSNFPQTFFDLHFSSKAGEKFLYDSGATHLLSLIINRTTGMSAEAYAKKHLFEPLKIKDYKWDKDPNGTHLGGWGLYLKPKDMAKFGYLIMKDGKWNKKQVVSKEWIKTATSKHIEGYWGETKADDYGYLWWLNPAGGFRADGYGGQYIFVIPEQDLIVVFTSGVNYSEKMQPINCLNNYILPSIKSSKELKPNPVSNMKLQSLVKSFEHPMPQKVAKLPEISKKISGKTFTMDSNIKTISFEFKNKNTCILNISQIDNKHKLVVGLDGVYRISEASKVGSFTLYPSYNKVALRGNWIDNNTFEIDWHYVGEPYSGKYKFTFDESNVLLVINEYLDDASNMTSSYKVINGKSE